MKISGVVVKWNSERDFGFISPSDGGVIALMLP